jgi:transposase
MSSKRKTAAVSVIGIDIGKNSFHVVAQDKRGAIVLRQKWNRARLDIDTVDAGRW